MGNIIVTEFITLDGVIEAPGGDETNHPHGGWNARHSNSEAGKYKMEELASVDALLLGRKTYEQFASYWPGQSGAEFADPINQLPKYVATKSLQQLDWNNSHIIRDVAKEVMELKKSHRGNILVYGSGALVKTLLHHDLVDQLTLMLHPVIVGGGINIFENNRELKTFGLKHSKVFDNGVVILEYQPKR